MVRLEHGVPCVTLAVWCVFFFRGRYSLELHLPFLLQLYMLVGYSVTVLYSEFCHDGSETNCILSSSHVLLNLGDLWKCRTFFQFFLPIHLPPLWVQIVGSSCPSPEPFTANIFNKKFIYLIHFINFKIKSFSCKHDFSCSEMISNVWKCKE